MRSKHAGFIYERELINRVPDVFRRVAVAQLRQFQGTSPSLQTAIFGTGALISNNHILMLWA